MTKNKYIVPNSQAIAFEAQQMLANSTVEIDSGSGEEINDASEIRSNEKEWNNGSDNYWSE